MNILVTGSSGYLGSQFINAYKDKHCFYSFSLLTSSLNKLDFKGIDSILHCAALVHQKKQYTYDEYEAINVDYPVTLAKKAKKCGVKHFVFISTVAVYGNTKNEVNEESKCSPTTFYAKSKLKAEEMLQQLEGAHFTVSIIRPPMVYGQAAPGNMRSLVDLVSRLFVLPLGNIHNARSFVYISNLVGMLHQVLEKRVGGVFLAGDDEAISTTQLVEHIAKGLGKQRLIVQVPLFSRVLKILKPEVYISLFGTLRVNNDKTKKALFFQNTVSVQQGIQQMLKNDN